MELDVKLGVKTSIVKLTSTRNMGHFIVYKLVNFG